MLLNKLHQVILLSFSVIEVFASNSILEHVDPRVSVNAELFADFLLAERFTVKFSDENVTMVKIVLSETFPVTEHLLAEVTPGTHRAMESVSCLKQHTKL
jgi:hypothetical protein